MTPANLQAALEFAHRDLPVFPLYSTMRLPDGRLICACGTQLCRNPAKHPLAHLAPHGLKNATTDEAAIREWWRLVPEANIGMATGSVIVLDVDPRHGGSEALVCLEHNHGPLPHTWRVLTGGGGEHVYFAAPDYEIRNSAGRLGPGLDIRGAGGYVVAPPSLHVSGRTYEWCVDHRPDHVPLAPMPDWMAGVLGERRGADLTRSRLGWRQLVAEGVSDGQRNTAVASLTGHLLRRYIDPEVAHQLVQAWNAARCRPPLSDEEVTRTVNSIARRELRRREAQCGRPS